jgi:hypothetical protein
MSADGLLLKAQPVRKTSFIGEWIIPALWPVLSWILGLIVFWQFCRMVWFWDTPGNHDGLWFTAYFLGLSALYYFAGVYRPTRFAKPDSPEVK